MFPDCISMEFVGSNLSPRRVTSVTLSSGERIEHAKRDVCLFRLTAGTTKFLYYLPVDVAQHCTFRRISHHLVLIVSKNIQNLPLLLSNTAWNSMSFSSINPSSTSLFNSGFSWKRDIPFQTSRIIKIRITLSFKNIVRFQ